MSEEVPSTYEEILLLVFFCCLRSFQFLIWMGLEVVFVLSLRTLVYLSGYSTESKDSLY